MSEVLKKAKAAKKVSFELVGKTTDEKNAGISKYCEAVTYR